MSVASRTSKLLSKAAEPTAADDHKTFKRLSKQIEAAKKVERKAEDLSPNSVEKQKVKEAEEAYRAFEIEYQKRFEERMKGYNKSADPELKPTDKKAQDFAKGGMVKKSRSNALNKFYGK